MMFGPMLDDLDKLVLESLKEIDRLEEYFHSSSFLFMCALFIRIFIS